MLSRASMMMTSLETLKTSFALDIKLFEESVSRDIGTEGARWKRCAPRDCLTLISKDVYSRKLRKFGQLQSIAGESDFLSESAKQIQFSSVFNTKLSLQH